jgi:hypothetical protein
MKPFLRRSFAVALPLTGLALTIAGCSNSNHPPQTLAQYKVAATGYRQPGDSMQKYFAAHPGRLPNSSVGGPRVPLPAQNKQ